MPTIRKRPGLWARMRERLGGKKQKKLPDKVWYEYENRHLTRKEYMDEMKRRREQGFVAMRDTEGQITGWVKKGGAAKPVQVETRGRTVREGDYMVTYGPDGKEISRVSAKHAVRTPAEEKAGEKKPAEEGEK